MEPADNPTLEMADIEAKVLDDKVTKTNTIKKRPPVKAKKSCFQSFFDFWQDWVVGMYTWSKG